MKGDFSRWNFDRKKNYDGVLHQQGRVLLDSDWNDQAMIINRWQDYASNDIIGSNRTVAVPEADLEDAFRVTNAQVIDNRVRIKVMPGRAWVDGMHMCLGDEAIRGKESQPLTFAAAYFENLSADAGSIGDGICDAIFLQVWREAVSGFQDTGMLIEPALGGADTTERVRMAAGFKLIRIGKGPSPVAISYDGIGKKLDETLKDLQAAKGTLTVTLNEDIYTTTGTGDAGSDSGKCPITAKGGYSGLEHYLYRVEIADVNEPKVPMFKWSRLNGSLAGRGKLAGKVLTIGDNRQAILSSGLTDCYVEFVAPDGSSGQYNVIYGAPASLNTVDEHITLDKPIFGEVDVFKQYGTDDLFFRLWNGTGKIEDYHDTRVLENGISLKFAKEGLYVPGDYWMFRARAGDNKTPVINGKPPQGIEYHYAPLALIEWNAAKNVNKESVSYRVPFVPLAHVFDRITTAACSRITVGNEKYPGNKKSLQDAIDEAGNEKKYPGGVEIVLQPGTHKANVQIYDRTNITIRGCGKNATTITYIDDRKPIFAIRDSRGITITGLTIAPRGSNTEGSAIDIAAGKPGTASDIEVRDNRIIAGGSAVRIKDAVSVRVRDNDVYILDRKADSKAMMASGKDLTIADNYFTVIDPGLYTKNAGKWNELDAEVRSAFDKGPVKAYKSAGGISFSGQFSRVRVANNYIAGGAGDGIALRENSSDVVIENNDIAGISSCGIRADHCTRIAIRDNRVRRCAYEDDPVPDGVIALSDCRHVDVMGNLVEENGIDHTTPILGICLLQCHFIGIVRNRVLNNGPLDTANLNGTSSSGRMGIQIFTNEVPGGTLDTPRFDIRENHVVQPAGCALFLSALGKISIEGNYFNSKLPGNEIGCVYIYGITGTSYSPMVGHNIDLDSNLVFSRNHVQFELITPKDLARSVWIPNSTDICFSDNVADYILYNAVQSQVQFTNTELYGNTIRASNNRLRERAYKNGAIVESTGITSLITEGLTMNVTKGNEADNKYYVHCTNAAEHFVDSGHGNINVLPK